MASTSNAGAERRALEHRYAVRRLRDVLRSNIFSDRYPEARMPAEADLMVRHGVTRAVLRDALALLRADGFIDRVQGYGTHALTVPRTDSFQHYQGINHLPHAGVWSVLNHTTLLSRRVVETPDGIDALIPGTAGRVLMIDYTAHSGAETWGVGTSYYRFPEAAALQKAAFGSDYWGFVADAGLTVGATRSTIGAGVIDDYFEEVLGVTNVPLIMFEHVLLTMTGEPFGVDFTRVRGDRMQMTAFASNPGYLGSEEEQE